MVVLIREFQSPDEEMKKIVLKVVKQCVGTEGVEPEYIRTEVGGGMAAWRRRQTHVHVGQCVVRRGMAWRGLVCGRMVCVGGCQRGYTRCHQWSGMCDG